jgi:hemerythrin-like domain-containing protein
MEALLIAKSLREAEEAGVVSRAFLDFWKRDGQVHFRVEEEVLLPAWARHAEVDRPAIARMLDDHLTIRREALRFAGGEADLAEVHELGRCLNDHVRFEERELFPAIEAALDPEQTEELAAAIAAAERAWHAREAGESSR